MYIYTDYTLIVYFTIGSIGIHIYIYIEETAQQFHHVVQYRARTAIITLRQGISLPIHNGPNLCTHHCNTDCVQATLPSPCSLLPCL